MRERFVGVTDRLLDEEPTAALVLAEISSDLFRQTSRRHPNRTINVGIREQLMIGVAGGLALAGLRPIVHTYAPFLVERPFEQVKLDLGYQGLGAILASIGASYDWAAGGGTHHAPGDVALLDTLPGWKVHVPGHPNEVETLLRAAIPGRDRVYIRLSDQANERAHPVGRGLVPIRRGHDATIIAVGPTLDVTVRAVRDLDVTVLYCSTPRPLDPTGSLSAAARDVVIVEPYLEGTSLASLVDALGPQPHRLLAIGVPRVECRKYGEASEHGAAHGLDAAGLRSQILPFVGKDPAALS